MLAAENPAHEINDYITNWHLPKDQVAEIASEHEMVLIEGRAAHNLDNIGLRYTEVDLDDLYARAVPKS